MAKEISRAASEHESLAGVDGEEQTGGVHPLVVASRGMALWHGDVGERVENGLVERLSHARFPAGILVDGLLALRYA